MLRKYCLLICSCLGVSFITPTNEVPKIQLFPNFTFKGLFDTTYKLTDLKGSYVLVNFWASWNEESRKMQIKQTPIYSKYHDLVFKQGTGFEIVSVSLDTEASEIQLALKKDRLNWVNQSCDFKAWEGNLVNQIALKGIPANFLIDPSGKILAQNIEADSLEVLLNSYQ